LKASTRRGVDTRNLILDVAEKLFAESGPAAVTVRAIATAANINTQAVNYHFGTKDRLFEEMFGRRVGPVNRERLERLDACMQRDSVPSLEQLVDAFVRPILRLRQESLGHERALVVMQFQARAVASPSEFEFSYLKLHFEPVRSRFMSAFSAMLPQLAIEDVIWRYNFMCGAIIYSMAGPMRMLRPPESMAGVKLRDVDNEEAAIENLVRFVSAGFRAGSLYTEARRTHGVETPRLPAVGATNTPHRFAL
jgi:AcrR family transcriptional regulator